MGSHHVDGNAAFRFCVVAEHHRAADIKKVGIRVAFQDGSSLADTGPTAGAAAPEEEKPAPKKKK